ncbi:hypothetical protein JW319_22315 [Enterobacter cloacae subsp. cloacae]|uniref:hypothetical protein n=1 Tax=Enterobacter cloacae TaxID=550 RepID=UPI001C5B52EA|nr:hypothetical protein [Enterobacter cloacae]MBW4204094.1 hypothetical protein [Enterobacter cloacae subsp. cloacae]
MNTNKSEKIQISLKMIREALLALGHEKIWFRENGSKVEIITWDGCTAARLNHASKSWEIQPNANSTFTNPSGIKPVNAEELTKEQVFQLSTVYP